MNKRNNILRIVICTSKDYVNRWRCQSLVCHLSQGTLRLFTTRDGLTDECSAYFNGAFMWSFIDDDEYSTVHAPNNALYFMIDDSDTEGENPTGFVDDIKIYDEVRVPYITEASAPSISALFLFVFTALFCRRLRAARFQF